MEYSLKTVMQRFSTLIMNRTILLILICGLSASAQKILVPPYLQPGNAPTLSKEQKVVIWQTDSIPGNFRVDFAAGASLEHAKKLSVAKVTSVQLKLLGKTSFLYRATLILDVFLSLRKARLLMKGLWSQK